MAFPKQITAAFDNTLRPHDLAFTQTRAEALDANSLANVLPDLDFSYLCMDGEREHLCMQRFVNLSAASSALL